MKRLLAITVVVLLSSAMFFVVVCTGAESVTKVTKGTWSGALYPVGQGICPAGTFQIINNGKGHMTLTGESEWFSVGCSDGLDLGGDAVITASNGDLLYLTVSGRIIPDTVDSGTWVEDEIIIGGTGMFEGATGEGHSSGPYKYIGGGAIEVWSGTNEGTITLPLLP